MGADSVALTLSRVGVALRSFIFKRRRFPVEIILRCVRWYCKYGISYRDLAEMMQERGVQVDPTTIMRWIHRYAPELEKRVRRFQGYGSTSWRADETYIKVGGRWKYLFRAVDKHGVLIARGLRRPLCELLNFGRRDYYWSFRHSTSLRGKTRGLSTISLSGTYLCIGETHPRRI